jgi:hypothetical protein
MRTAVAAPVLGFAALLAFAGPAAAADGSVQATLAPVPVNPVDGSGQAMVEISGTTLSFTLAAEGLGRVWWITGARSVGLRR